jgi:hypothetical protein
MRREGQENEGAAGERNIAACSQDHQAPARMTAAGARPAARATPEDVPWSVHCSNHGTFRDELWGFMREMEARGNARVTSCVQQAQQRTRAAQARVATRESEPTQAQTDVAALQIRVGEERSRGDEHRRLYRHENASVDDWRARFKASQDSLSWEEKQHEQLQSEHKRSEDQRLAIAGDLKETSLQHQANDVTLQRHGAATLAERDQSQRLLQQCIQESVLLRPEHEAAKTMLQGEVTR